MKQMSCYRFFIAKDNRPLTSGWQVAPYVFQGIWPGAGFKAGDFVRQKLGGLP